MALSVINGIAVGSMFSQSRQKAEEIKQGENHALAVIPQLQQVVVNIFCAKELFIACGSYTWGAACGLQVLSFGALPLLIAGAATKHGRYSDLASWINRYLPEGLQLPEQLSERASYVLKKCSDGASPLLQVAALVQLCALVALGHYAFASAFGVFLGYQLLDEWNQVPFSLALSVEKYMPLLINGAFFLSGSLLAFFFASLDLAFRFPTFAVKFDAFINDRFSELNHRLTLQGCYAKQAKPDITEAEAASILRTPWKEFEIDTASCMDPLVKVSLANQAEFTKLLTFFDEVAWHKKERYLSLKLLDDDRFIAYMKGQDLEPTLEAVAALAEKNGMSVALFLSRYLREQMVELVLVLTLEKQVKGDKADLADARDHCSMIIPYLPKASQIEREDMLLQLAVEGGAYCARGIKRVSHEIVHGQIMPTHVKLHNPDQQFEFRLKKAWYDARVGVVQQMYAKITQAFPKEVKQDIHGMDMYRILLSMGVLPRTENETFTFDQYLFWKIFGVIDVHKDMYRGLGNALGAGLPNITNMDIVQYVRRKFGDQLVLDHTGSRDDYYKLIYFMNGMIRKKESNSDTSDFYWRG